MNFGKLKKRDRIIRSFRKSYGCYRGMDLGYDPMNFQPRENLQLSVMFIDMRDYTSFAESVETSESYEILNEYLAQLIKA